MLQRYEILDSFTPASQPVRRPIARLFTACPPHSSPQRPTLERLQPPTVQAGTSGSITYGGFYAARAAPG